MDPINVSNWQIDEQFSPYPEGSRDKYALISPKNCSDPNILSGHRYLLKFSNPRYPVQFWSEIIAFRVAVAMNVKAPACFLSFDPNSGELGSLNEWFYGPKIERDELIGSYIEAIEKKDASMESFAPDQDVSHAFSLYVPGSSYMARFIEDYDFEKGKKHNLKTLRNLVTRIRMIYGVDYWPYWAMIFTFDAMIGNTDRHQDNWGILWRRNQAGDLIPRFAPAFDNGTSLLHEMMDVRMQSFADPAFRRRYIAKGRHHIRATIDAPKPLGHLELIEELIRVNPNLHSYIASTLAFDMNALRADVMELCSVNCAVPLSTERAEAILAMLADRQAILRNDILGIDN